MLPPSRKEEVFEFLIGEEGFDLGSEDEAVVVVEGDESAVEGGIEGRGEAEPVAGVQAEVF
ncbi:hypothetical protein N9916_00545 [Akkermansiaceae bacterium]|nr:hypothetical protein [Akkermansiaceae bacterium]